VAATAGTVLVLPSRVFGANEKLNVACIGCGGKGGGDIGDISGENIVALCDTDAGPLGGQAKKHTAAKTYKDFRKLFDEMGKSIDAVTVSTPDHTHFPASMAALMLGKHVFTQKPLTHNIWEARRLAEVAREKKVATFMGIQGHSNEAARRLCEWVWAGKLGNVKEVHYYTNRPIWPQGVDRPKDSKPVPGNLDWDCWLNVAQDRPYHDAYCPFRWRGWYDYGAGALGDIGCHVMDAAFWALDLRDPTSVEAEVSDNKPESFPAWSRITYNFPARGQRGPVKVLWCDGKKGNTPNEPPRPKEMEGNLPKETYAIVYGDKNVLLHDFYCGSARIIPETKMKESEAASVPKTLGRAPGHMRDFIRTCKGENVPTVANYEYAAALTEMVHLGNLCLHAKDKRIEWDGAKMKVTNDAEADKWVRRQPRKGWEQYYGGKDVPEPPKPPIGNPA
jgi:predicted dehydrogenase